MQDFVGVEGVLSKARLQELSQRADGPALGRLAAHFGVIAANTAAMAWTWGTWWCVPFFLLQGVLINFLYAPEHECDHFTAFETRWLNIGVARICGFLIVLPNDYHRWSHYAHHRHTQDWEKDTELERDVMMTPWQYLKVLSGLPSTWDRVSGLSNHALGRCNEWYATPAQKRTMIRSARWHVAGYALVLVSAVLMQSWWPLYYWIGPLVAMRWTYWLQGLGEHGGLTHEPNTLLNTRTLTTSWFMRWVNWNMTYHTVHHTFPSVPFYRLPELHREVEAKLGHQLPSSPYFKLHWRHVRKMLDGATEHDLCDTHTRQVIEAGQLRPAAPR